MLDDEVAVVADFVHMHVGDDPVVGQRLAQGREFVDADLQLAQQRIGEPLEIVMAIAARGEDVCRLVDRHRRQRRLVIGGHAEQYVAIVGVEGLPDQTALVERAPEIGHARPERLGDHLGDLVVEPLFPDVRERHVAGVGADMERGEMRLARLRLGGVPFDLRVVVEFLVVGPPTGPARSS